MLIKDSARIQDAGTILLKRSGKFGQRAKMYPTRTDGYENDGTFQTSLRLLWRLRRCVVTRRCKRSQPSDNSTQRRWARGNVRRLKAWQAFFSDKVKKAENKESQIKELHAKIGQLAVENGTAAFAVPLALSQVPKTGEFAEANGVKRLAC